MILAVVVMGVHLWTYTPGMFSSRIEAMPVIPAALEGVDAFMFEQYVSPVTHAVPQHHGHRAIARTTWPG